MMNSDFTEQERLERNYYARLRYRRNKLARSGIKISIAELRKIDELKKEKESENRKI